MYARLKYPHGFAYFIWRVWGHRSGSGRLGHAQSVRLREGKNVPKMISIIPTPNNVNEPVSK